MRILDLHTAAGEIVQAAQESGTRPPFFLVVGAGISSPPIPLASDIENECRAIAISRKRVQEPQTGSAMESYSHWFELALPHPKLRQQYLQRLIEGKPISHATFRLAHLVANRTLANVVITPNFDDFLSKALMLFGERHVICDHPNTVERIDPESNEIQIVHVHGTHWFYNCCNLQTEIEERSTDSRDQAVTMTSLLDAIMARRSAIVVGYSGWEHDAIMTALKRRLHAPLPINLYWFCYRQKDLDRLPLWLQNHSDVRFVLPEGDAEPAELPIPTSSEGTSELPATTPAEIEQQEPTLPAQKVFDVLVQQFGLEPPLLTTDPLRFFAEQLRKSLPAHGNGDLADIYQLRHVVEIVEQVNVTAREISASYSERNVEGEEVAPRLTSLSSELEQVRVALRKSDYQQAIEVSQMLLETRSQENLSGLVPLLLPAAAAMDDDSELKIAAFDVAIQILENSQQSITSPLPVELAKALFDKASALAAQRRYEEALVSIEDFIARFGSDTRLELRRGIARAWLNKARLQRRLENRDAAAETLQNTIDAFVDDTDLGVATEVMNAGVMLSTHQSGSDSTSALGTIDRLLTRYNNDPKSSLQSAFVRLLGRKAALLRQVKRSTEAITICDRVIKNCGTAEDSDIQASVARAYVAKALTLEEMNEVASAIAVYGECIQKFMYRTDQSLRITLGLAMLNKAQLLCRLDRDSEALELLNALTALPAHESIRYIKFRGLVAKGIVLTQLDRDQEAVITYDEALGKIADVPKEYVTVEKARALVNKGISLGALRRPSEALEAYDQALENLSRCAEDDDTNVGLAKAMAGRAVCLAQVGKESEARKAAQTLRDKFAKSEVPEIRAAIEDCKRLLRRREPKNRPDTQGNGNMPVRPN